MDSLERLENYADILGIGTYPVQNKDLNGFLVVQDGVKAIGYGSALDRTQKAMVVAEELGHYHTDAGDSLLAIDHNVGRAEERAMRWAVARLIPFDKLVAALLQHPANEYELAEMLEVTEALLQKAMQIWQAKYEFFYECDEYVLVFMPLGYYIVKTGQYMIMQPAEDFYDDETDDDLNPPDPNGFIDLMG
jgi:hypothetical protein